MRTLLPLLSLERWRLRGSVSARTRSRAIGRGCAPVGLSEKLRDLKPAPARILTLDIETSPAVVYTFNLAADYINPNNIIEPTRVLCFAAKWYDSPGTIYFGEDKHTREEMVQGAWQLLDEADMVVTYNGVRFDIPHLQREMVTAGYRPPSSWTDVDLLPVVKRRFRFMSNRLGHITEQLGLDTKADAGGFDTWRKVLAGDREAWRRFAYYCRTDVQVTEQLFTYLRPWLKLPHAGLFTADMAGCFACGCDRLAPDGIARSKVHAWLRLICQDCGAANRMLANGETRQA